VCGGKQGIKIEGCGEGREGGFIPASRFPVEPLVELLDKTREGGIGLLWCGNAVQSEPDGQTALEGLPEPFNTPLCLGASGGNKFAA
jgi:hypothetical protein